MKITRQLFAAPRDIARESLLQFASSCRSHAARSDTVDILSSNAHQKYELLLSRGIGLEAGVWNPRAAALLRRSGMIDACLRVLLEPAEEFSRTNEAVANLDAIEMELSVSSVPRLLHRLDDTAWFFVQLAAERGKRLKLPIVVTDVQPGFVDTDMAKADRLFWVASPQTAARQIAAAIRRRKRRVYVTRRWRLIAWLLRIIPDAVYAKL